MQQQIREAAKLAPKQAMILLVAKLAILIIDIYHYRTSMADGTEELFWMVWLLKVKAVQQLLVMSVMQFVVRGVGCYLKWIVPYVSLLLLFYL